jgi:hypothetical protein
VAIFDGNGVISTSKRHILLTKTALFIDAISVFLVQKQRQLKLQMMLIIVAKGVYLVTKQPPI